MIFRYPDGPIKIAVKSRSEMESQLDLAVQHLRGKAEKSKDRGILVTRLSAHDFTVELHPSVPFGITHELQKW